MSSWKEIKDIWVRNMRSATTMIFAYLQQCM